MVRTQAFLTAFCVVCIYKYCIYIYVYIYNIYRVLLCGRMAQFPPILIRVKFVKQLKRHTLFPIKNLTTIISAILSVQKPRMLKVVEFCYLYRWLANKMVSHSGLRTATES